MICQPFCYLYTNCSRPSSRSTSPCSGNSSRASSCCRPSCTPCVPCTPCTPCRPCTPCTPRTPVCSSSRQNRRQKISDFAVGGCDLGSDSKDTSKLDKKKGKSKGKAEGKGKKIKTKDRDDENTESKKGKSSKKEKDSKDKESKAKEGKELGKKTKKDKGANDDDSASIKKDKKEKGKKDIDDKKDKDGMKEIDDKKKDTDELDEKDSKDEEKKTDGIQAGEDGQDKTKQGLCTPRLQTCLNPLCPSNLRKQQSFQMLQPRGRICYSNQRSAVFRREKPERCNKCGKKKRPKKQVQGVDKQQDVSFHNQSMINDNNFSSMSYPVMEQAHIQSKMSNSPLYCCSSHCSHIITMVTKNNQMIHYHMSDFKL
ncbi:uncharacterized protein LOC143199115 [Rhynchophorus ferrugineus]|uniref:uncharacterized protein LOC143199115 n=1 Tax=Rhynchophorus ferrugineus TaxID=354439 RepID=UPI003FCC8AEB